MLLFFFFYHIMYLHNEWNFFVLIAVMSFYPYYCGNNKITKKTKAFLINQLKSEQKSSSMGSP